LEVLAKNNGKVQLVQVTNYLKGDVGGKFDLESAAHAVKSLP
jgi:hypothetical protein